VVDSSGCPRDSDGDGVFDGLDRCPGTPRAMAVDSAGCPLAIRELEDELVRTSMIRLTHLPFEAGKAKLLPAAEPTLDALGRVLLRWPDLRWEVGGHTDVKGSKTDNRQLSEARAIAVLYDLLRRFKELRREQFTVRGYGGTQPLVPAKNPESATRNPRIELKVLNTEVLQREITHRKLLRIQPALGDTLKKEKP
jgi:OOP family OmpA-OmpF porin